jgi:hypothetical protein
MPAPSVFDGQVAEVGRLLGRSNSTEFRYLPSED